MRHVNLPTYHYSPQLSLAVESPLLGSESSPVHASPGRHQVVCSHLGLRDNNGNILWQNLSWCWGGFIPASWVYWSSCFRTRYCGRRWIVICLCCFVNPAKPIRPLHAYPIGHHAGARSFCTLILCERRSRVHSPSAVCVHSCHGGLRGRVFLPNTVPQHRSLKKNIDHTYIFVFPNT